MRKYTLTKCVLALMINILLFAGIACAVEESGKIPVTTSSDEALSFYLQGRDLFEKLRAQESREFFEKAIASDSNFALAHLNLGFALPSARGFFEQLDKALALVAKVSDGERLMILAIQAGANADPMKQRQYYRELVATYPTDERAHNLLGNNYFGQQEYAAAIEEYNKAVKINAEFSQPYNQLGYSYRFLGDYIEAEKAFKKYIELIPDDPNPYDSYAELLLKIGKYDASIEFYQKALAVNPNFVASYVGIATNLNILGKHEDARAKLQELLDTARDNGQRRTVHFAKAVSFVDEGEMDKALEQLTMQHAFAKKIDDAAAMAADFVATGNILLEIGKLDEAMAKYEQSVEFVEKSKLAQEVKDNVKRGFLYNAARVALKKKDFATAKAKSKEYQKQVEAINNPFQIRLSHELAGMIALEEKDHDKALQELQQANQQNPYNFYRMALACEGKGDKRKAKKLCMKAAEFNALNNLNYAFIRNKAKQMLADM